MTRPVFYPSNDAYVLSSTGEPQAGIPVRIFTRQSGGTQVTDLQYVNSAGTATGPVPAGVLMSDSNGLLPAFAGPDAGPTTLWGDHGMSGERLALTADPMSGSAAGAVSSVDGLTGAVSLGGRYAPLWRASAAYTSGQVVVLPDGYVGTAKTSFTSGPAYDAADWNIPNTSSAGYDGGTF